MLTAYYNEIDPYAAQWLRNLITAGAIAPGDVDERSIVDVRAGDLTGFAQCHFFAGVGGWSYALRLAGWPDDRPVWTGSCPCQPFSAAGAGKAADDQRHLWPAWFSLIAEQHPAIVFGEQVEAAIGWGWLDLVLTDLEGQGYACGASVLPSCSVGAPHIRQRLWFVADANGGNACAEGLQRGGEHGQRAQDGRASERMGHAAINGSGAFDGESREGGKSQEPFGGSSLFGELADTLSAGRPEGRPLAGDGQATGSGGAGGVVNATGEQEGVSRCARQSGSAMGDSDREREAPARGLSGRPLIERGRSPWAEAEWIACRDGKRRPVEPGTFPLATGIPGRMGRLRAFGNAITPQVAAEFIAAYRECQP